MNQPIKPSLVPVREKICRAKHHFEQLNASIQTWGRSEEIEHFIGMKYYAKRNRGDFHLTDVKANNPDWPLITGDVVHNIRSALDHLVGQLALIQDPKCDLKKTAFPIHDNPKSFQDNGKPRIVPFIHVDAVTEIEGLQPYKTCPQNPRGETLFVLSELDIIDKHRILLVAAKHFRATYLSLSINNIPRPLNFICDNWQPLKDGAPLGSFDLSGIIPDKKDVMHVQGETECQVILTDTGLVCDGDEVKSALSPCIARVEGIVNDFGKKFFGE